MNKTADTNTGIAEWLRQNKPALLAAFIVIGGIAVIFYQANNTNSRGQPVAVSVPGFSKLASLGKKNFAQNCAQCHGAHGAGGLGGPPLIHSIYNPGHHGDGAFTRAMAKGVRQHHWQFGDMPPQRQVDAVAVKAIIRYIRELQVANGIGK